MSGQIKSEQRRSRRLHGMTEHTDPLIRIIFRETTAGDKYTIGLIAAAVSKIQGKATICLCDGMNRLMVMNRNTSLLHFTLKTVYNGLRAIRNRKHPPVRLRLELYAALFEPIDGILRRKMIQRFLKQLL